MKDSKKLETFTKALKKAKEGDLFNFDRWLEDNGVNPRTINLKYFYDHFRANPDKMIGNDTIIQKVAEYIGHFLKEKKGFYHIPIIGIKGSGKTLILNILEGFTSNFKTNLGTSIDIIGEGGYLLQDFDSKQITKTPERVRIHFIDNCEKVDNITKIIENILILKGDSVYITSWTPESWIHYKEKISNILPISEEFILLPLKLGSVNEEWFDHYFSFLNHLLHSIMHQKRLVDKNFPYVYPDFTDVKFVNDELCNIFYKCTLGIPLISIKLLLNSIEKTFLLKKKEMDEQTIVNVAEKMGLKNVKKRLNNLTELHLQMLSTILLETKNKGTRPIQLVKEFDLDKSTISYHLNTLKELEFLYDEKIGKSKFYNVKENLTPFIQLRILNDKYYLNDNVFKDFIKKWKEKNLP